MTWNNEFSFPYIRRQFIKHERRQFCRFHFRYRPIVNVLHLNYSSFDDNDDLNCSLLVVESGLTVLCLCGLRNSFCTFELALYRFQTSRATGRDLGGTEQLGLHTNRDWHRNLWDRKTPREFSIR